MDDRISILGLDDFDSIEKRKIMDYAEKYKRKIFRDVNGLLIINSKKHKKEGKRVKYSFHVRLEAPETIVDVKDYDWVLSTALNKVFIKVENKLQHKFKLKGRK